MAQELVPWQPSTSLSPTSKHEAATAMVRYSTSRLSALEQAKKLIGHYPHARPPDTSSYANGLADIFQHYPFGVVEQCCDVFDGIASTKVYLPAPAEVRQWCDLRLQAYQSIVRRGLPPPEIEYSEEHCATMRERLSKLMHSIFDEKHVEAAE